MPFDSKGNFNRLHNWEDDRINDIEIVTDHMDEEDNNFADGLSQCFLKTGYSKMQGNIDVGNNQIKNVANGTSALDGVNKSQLDNVSNALAEDKADKSMFQVVSELPENPDADTYYFIEV